MVASFPLRYLFFVCLSLFAFVFGSCGFPPVPKASNRPIDRVSESSASSFFLTDLEFKRTYRGSLLIWKPSTSREDVAAIFGATQSYNNAFEQSRRVLMDLDNEVLQPLESDIRMLTEELEKLSSFTGNPQKLREGRIQVAGSWFENWQRSLSEEYGEAIDGSRSRNILQWYCDAKLWELAVQPWLADGQLSLIPVAHPQCQLIYEAQGYFDSPICLTGGHSEAVPFDPFACIWEALSKTRFVTVGPLDSRKTPPILLALARNPKFRSLVSGKQGELGFCGLQNLHVKRLPSFRSLPIELECDIDGTGLQFEWGVRLGTVSSASRPEELSAYDLGRLIDGQLLLLNRENTRSRYPQSLLVVETAGLSREGRQLSPLEMQSDAFAARLSALGERRAICGERPDRFSAADIYFSLPFSSRSDLKITPVQCQEMPDEKVFPELRSDDRENDVRRDTIRKNIEQRNADRNSGLASYCDVNNGRPESASRLSEMEARFKQTQEVEARAILASRDFALILSQDSRSDATRPSIVRVELSFLPGEVAAAGCFEANSGRSVSCARSSSSEAGLMTSLEPQSGGLSVALDFSQISIDEKLFRSFPEELRTSRMSVTFFRSALGDGLMPFVSGRTRFETIDGLKATGEASYLFEVDGSYQRANALVSECPALSGD